MRLHRFYIEQRVGEVRELTISDTELIHQMVNVFRFKNNDKVILFDGSGFEYEAEIISTSKKEISFNILNVTDKSMKQDSKKVSLYLALIKKGNFELAAEKSTEVGVAEIHPVVSLRSEKKDLNIERLNKIVKEASEQCGRVTLPVIADVTDLETAVSQAVSEGKVCVTFHTDTDQTSSSSECHSALSKAEIDGRHEVAAFVGPEGGWTEDEMELFKKNNFIIKSLGQNVLRAETAAMVAVWGSINN